MTDDDHRRRQRVRRRVDWWEKLVIYVVFPLLTAAILAAAGMLWQANRAEARNTENIAHLIRAQTTMLQRLAQLEAQRSELYTRAEADGKHHTIWRTDRDQYDKLSALKSSLSDQASRLRGDVIALQLRVDAHDDAHRGRENAR